MENFGVYTWWHYFRKGETSGQVATLITLAIAVIFLFVAITLNIGRVAQKKTVTANAADGAAMKLASYIGSYANKLSMEYVKGGTSYCKRNWGGFWKLLATIVLILIAPYLSPYLAEAAWLAAAISAVSYGIEIGVMPGKIADRIQRQLNKLALEDNLTEQAIMYALAKSVDDPEKVVDLHDYDEDGDVTDTIPRFSKWYAERVNALVDASSSGNAKISDFIPRMEEFAETADEFRQEFTEDPTRPLIIDCAECDEDEEPTVPAGIEGKFVTLLKELENEEIEVSFWKPDADTEANSDAVDGLSTDLNTFYIWALGEEGGLLYQEFDSIVRMYDMWVSQLYTEEPQDTDEEESETWYATWEEQIQAIDSWRPELYGAIARIDELILEEADPLREEYLLKLQARTSDAILTLDNFQDTLRDFNTEILTFYLQSEENTYVHKRNATYSWHDSLGWHHLRADVSEFKMPWIKVKKKKRWYGYKICVYLKEHTGDVTVKVVRFDESTAAFFARNRSTPLWKFRYIKDARADEQINPANPEQALAYGIESQATARYNYSGLPRIVSVK